MIQQIPRAKQQELVIPFTPGLMSFGFVSTVWLTVSKDVGGFGLSKVSWFSIGDELWNCGTRLDYFVLYYAPRGLVTYSNQTVFDSRIWMVQPFAFGHT